MFLTSPLPYLSSSLPRPVSPSCCQIHASPRVSAVTSPQIESQSLEESPPLRLQQQQHSSTALGCSTYISPQIWEMETELVQETGGLVANLCPIANSQYGGAQSLPHFRTQFPPPQKQPWTSPHPSRPSSTPTPLWTFPIPSGSVWLSSLCSPPWYTVPSFPYYSSHRLMYNSWLVCLSLLDTEHLRTDCNLFSLYP